MNTICLNMIVRNESASIQRCLESVKHLIDTWVIVDTGSTDGTQDLIRKILADIPGELHEQKWVNFEVNRTQALSLAKTKANYTLFMDADQVLTCSTPLEKELLNQDFYSVVIREQVVDYVRPFLIKNSNEWLWVGKLHEELVPAEALSGEILANVFVDGRSRTGYRSSNPDTPLNDAKILEEMLQEDPNNSRTVFFLAQSYLFAKSYDLALKYYQQRAQMGGAPGEIFWSLYCIACLQEDLSNDTALILRGYLQAFDYDRSRAEPLYSLMRYLLKLKQYGPAFFIGALSFRAKVPQTASYICRDIYDYKLVLCFAYAAHLMGMFVEATAMYNALLLHPSLPDGIRKEVEQNAAACKEEKGFTGGTLDQ